MMNTALAPFPSFAHRLRRLRRAAGLKQFTLAQDLGVDQTTVSRWETGLQTPTPAIQHQALRRLDSSRRDDAALRRLVEGAGDCVHLVVEATHECLAYSHSRAKDWGTSQKALLGVSLWQFATDEIQQAEADLTNTNWWSEQSPNPMAFQTSGQIHPEITIMKGGILWERLYLSDGTPVRLVSSF